MLPSRLGRQEARIRFERITFFLDLNETVIDI